METTPDTATVETDPPTNITQDTGMVNLAEEEKCADTAPTEVDTGAWLQTPQNDKEVRAEDFPTPANQVQYPVSPAPKAHQDRPDCAFANTSLVDAMHFQNIMRQTFATVRTHGFCLPSEISEKDYHGQVLFAGTQSAGKTSVVTRIVGKEILPSGPNLSTRCPTVIFLATSEEQVLQIILPEVTKKGRTVIKGEFYPSVSPEEGKKLIKEFNDKINEFVKKFKKTPKELEDIVTEEIKIVYKSPYVPTIKLLNIPGLVPVAMSSNANKFPRKILKKYTNKKEYGSIDLLLVESAEPGSTTGLCKQVRNLSNEAIIYTNIDKVSCAHLLPLELWPRKTFTSKLPHHF